jgi:hypothetical protein
MKSLGLGIVLLTATAAANPTNELIARFPLDADGSDALGRNPPATVKHASFADGAFFLNGRYEYGVFTNGFCTTFPVKELNYESFTVALDFCPLGFKPDRTLNPVELKLNWLTFGGYWRWFGPERSDNTTILTGGLSYRWLGFSCVTSTLQLTLNNQSFTHSFSNAPLTLRRWHNLICAVDVRQRRIVTMLDGRLLETIKLPDNFLLAVIGSPSELTDREISFANYSNGSAYHGYAANLKAFARALNEAEMAALYAESPAERAGLKTYQTGVANNGPHIGMVVAVVAPLLILWAVLLRFKRRQG